MTVRVLQDARHPRRNRATLEFTLLFGVMKTEALPLRGARKAKACLEVGTLIKSDGSERRYEGCWRRNLR